MRSFLAIKVHPNAAIEDYFTRMKGTKGHFKPVRLDQLHLTLKFFGEVDEGKLEEIRDVIMKTTEEVEAFSFELFGCGAFPNENYLKVLWLGARSEEPLVELGNDLQKAFSGIGFKRDRFSPHLTLFRVKSPRNKKQIQDVMGEHKETSFGTVDVKELLLMKSELTPQGPIYTVIERFGLGTVE